MNHKRNLWGELPQIENLRTPYTILKEQGSILTGLTDGLLIGEVERAILPRTEISVLHLKIKVPALNNYTISVVEVQYPYPAQLYPARVESSAIGNFMQECRDESEFEQALSEILSSPEVKRVISALLADIGADQPSNV